MKVCYIPKSLFSITIEQGSTVHGIYENPQEYNHPSNIIFQLYILNSATDDSTPLKHLDHHQQGFWTWTNYGFPISFDLRSRNDGAHYGSGKLALGVLAECLMMQVPRNCCWERITIALFVGVFLSWRSPRNPRKTKTQKVRLAKIATCNWEWLMVSILGGAVGIFRNYGKTMGGSFNSKLGYTSSCIRFFRPGNIVEAIPSGKLA